MACPGLLRSPNFSNKINFWKAQVQDLRLQENFPSKINFWKVQLLTPNSWGRFSNFPKVVNECLVKQGYWFANNPQHPAGVHPWPNDITIGGYSYSNADGIAIWNSSNALGIPDAKKAFTQLAAVLLSGADQTPIATDVATIQNWLTSLGQKLSATYLPMESDADVLTYGDVRTAAVNISTYIQAHECAGSE